ncbi:anaphase-promoting complex, cyclosome, subunit 4-domain-containing protein [Cristinia sonorae]|uniref:Anaphase-promoting complex subunit 4 n=1 Tax=Cristinia sonorae TaxID=1940300 RepID=A0A8K0UT85_9AGAR|nr:anaphase-promoting complex, cyclosome, subunit 4-domain-containing protein [Cristinia sonorae]
MNGNAFSPIANLHLPSTSRIFRSSWCPDKDLLLIASRSPSGDKLSLWKMQGSKKWEFEFDKASTSTTGIVDVAWSPDGTFIAVAHHPATITIHSFQDGAQYNILFPRIKAGLSEKPNISGVWWFKRRDEKKNKSMPDLLRRNDLIPGSALSVLQSQPLLDTLYDEMHAMSTTELFSFQSTAPRNPPRYLTPQVIANWPSLPSDLAAATLRSKKVAKQKQRPGEELDEPDYANVNSLLVVADQSGNVWTYMDGSYPLGFVSYGLPCSAASFDTTYGSSLFIYPQMSAADVPHTSLTPFTIHYPLLDKRYPRDVARVSTAVKDLTYFAICVVKEMRTAWFGSDTHSGARSWGSKWIKDLEARQKDQFGIKEPNAIMDLTTLLVTGRATESLSDFLGSSDQMSERGIQKWESAILEALVRIRDYSEKLLTPAAERLYILTTEVRGWAALSQHDHFELSMNDITHIIIGLSRALLCTAWLAAAARTEFARYIEFITWVRYETARSNQQTDVHNIPPPRHDILEVNEYLISGLVDSPIDKWFTGQAPTFQPQELGGLAPMDIETSLAKMHEILEGPNGLTDINMEPPDISSIDRNIDALFTDISAHFRRLFFQASHGTSRAAVVSESQATAPPPAQPAVFPTFTRHRSLMTNEPRLQYLAIQSPCIDEQSYLFLIRITNDNRDPPGISTLSAAPLQCSIAREGEAAISVEVLDAEFFDEEKLIVVYRVRGRTATYMGTVNYVDLSYRPIDASWDVNCNSREWLMRDLLERLEHGQVWVHQTKRG